MSKQFAPFSGPYEFYQEHVTGIRIRCPQDCPNHGTHVHHDLITPQNMGPHDLGNMHGREQFRATWRLMAAAPDLLEACHYLIGAVEAGDSIDEAVSRARATIKKAEG